MEEKRKTRKVCCLLCVFMGTFFSCILYAGATPVNFDCLYPDTPFKVMLCSCLNVLQECDLLRNNKNELCDYELLTDIIVGKLFHIKMNIDNINLQRPPAHSEDIEFLEAVFDKILLDYTCTCSRYLNKPKSGYVVQLIRDIKCKCENLR